MVWCGVKQCNALACLVWSRDRIFISSSQYTYPSPFRTTAFLRFSAFWQDIASFSFDSFGFRSILSSVISISNTCSWYYVISLYNSHVTF